VTGLQPSIYWESSYWTSSPTFFADRAGLVLLALAVADSLAGLLPGRSPEGLDPLSRLGRASLLIYWVHVQITYGWITSTLHKQLNLGQLAVAYAGFCLAMYALIPLRDRLLLRGRPSGAWASRELAPPRREALPPFACSETENR
jgi:hypothetical protein